MYTIINVIYVYIYIYIYIYISQQEQKPINENVFRTNFINKTKTTTKTNKKM